jgi:prolyl-tRNA synthetase
MTNEIINFSDWFNDIILNAELADLRYNIKGIVVYREWSVYSINKIFRRFEDEFYKYKHKQLIMPTLIHEDNFLREAEHVEGFIPEVFWVTEHGNEKFENKYALRPTSETAFYYMFNYWIHSYKDLPYKTYQRANIFRYDTKATKPFFRGREFYFFETHNLYRTYEDSYNQVLEDMAISKQLLFEEYGIPFIFFKRPQWDKFPGAEYTFAADTILPNGRIIQLATTHLLGQNFTKSFDVKFKDKDEETKYPYSTCFGPGITRIYGGLISVHGDNSGLILPFNLAPIQIIITPLFFKDNNSLILLNKVNDIKLILENIGYIVEIDVDKDRTPKERFTFYEMKGVPIRIEIGPKEILENKITIFRRDNNVKEKIDIADLINKIDEIKCSFDCNLKTKAEYRFNEKLKSANTLLSLKKELDKNNFVKIPFCSIDKDGISCADILKTETGGGEVRGIRMDVSETPMEKEQCIICNKIAKCFVYIGKTY